MTSRPESPESALRCEELAGLLAARGEIDDATALYERAVAIKRQVLGPRHPDLARTLHDLALLQQSSGLVEEAGALWAEARRILDLEMRRNLP